MADTLKGLLHNLNSVNYGYDKLKLDGKEAALLKPVLEKAIEKDVVIDGMNMRCGTCGMPVHELDVHCHSCGQKLNFPL